MNPVDVSLLRPYRWAVSDNRRWERFEHRAGDIFVCTPPKCGTTWMQTIVASLLWPDGDVPGQVMTLSPWIDANFFPIDEILGRLEAQAHRRFIKTHTPADGIPWFDRASYIVVGRDGRDAFMSLCNHYEHFKGAVREELNARAAIDGVFPIPGWDGDVHRFFEKWLKEAAMLQHIASFWRHQRDGNLAFVHYNDLKADLAGEMRRVRRRRNPVVLSPPSGSTRRCFQFFVELSNHPPLNTWHEPQQRAMQIYFFCAGIKTELWPSWVESQVHPLEQHGMSDKIRRYLQ